jgi:hypothetical protein
MSSLIYIISKEKWVTMKIDMKIAYIMLILDLGGACTVFFNSVNNLAGNGLFVANQTLCNTGATLLNLFYITSIYCVGVVSLERCLLIVFKREYSDKFYYYIIVGLFVINVASCVIAWSLNGFSIYPVSVHCYFNLKTIGGFVGSFLTVVTIGISDALIFVCYPMICIYRKNQSQRSQLELGLDPQKVRKEVNRVIFKSLLIIIVSLVTNGPIVIILIVTWFNPYVLTPVIDCWQCILIDANILLNLIILLNMKPELTKSLKQLWRINTE